MQNSKNEELINLRTEQIIKETVSQEEWFANLQFQGGKSIQQCAGCKCKNAKCLKAYCVCLRNKATCGPSCQCKKQGDTIDEEACYNNNDHKEIRKNAIREILKRNLQAFEDKVDKGKAEHFKGCKCKSSMCQKKYCECFERNVPCTDKCKCLMCKNDINCVHRR